MTTPSLRWLSGLCIAVLALAAAPLRAQEAVIAKRTTDLRSTPADSGQKLETLAEGTPLTRLGPRQGPWVQVRTQQGKTGWLHMFTVGVAGGAAQGSALRDPSSLFNRGTQGATVTATSTVGIRGLGQEELARAQPNLRAVTQMESQRVDAGAARQFARGAARNARQVDELPAPSWFTPPREGGE